MNKTISRRSALRTLAGSTAALSAAALLPSRLAAAVGEAARPPLTIPEVWKKDEQPLGAEATAARARLKGHIHHSASAWCYGSLFNPGKNKPAKMTFEEFCKACAGLGLESVELLGPKEWPAVQKAGLICAMCNGPDNIGYGWNRLDHHDKLVEGFEKAIPEVAQFGYPNIITFSGNRKGMSDQEGLENCVKGLKRIVGIAEKNKVTVNLELLNSKVDHKDYMADHSVWGIEVCKQVGSERLKLLFDIYHMQIMEGDIVRSIRESGQYFGHYHTGGIPGRNEIDDTQELHYPAVMRAIVASGYKGYVGQEFVPKGDPLKSLEDAVRICDV